MKADRKTELSDKKKHCGSRAHIVQVLQSYYKWWQSALCYQPQYVSLKFISWLYTSRHDSAAYPTGQGHQIVSETSCMGYACVPYASRVPSLQSVLSVYRCLLLYDACARFSSMYECMYVCTRVGRTAIHRSVAYSDIEREIARNDGVCILRLMFVTKMTKIKAQNVVLSLVKAVIHIRALLCSSHASSVSSMCLT